MAEENKIDYTFEELIKLIYKRASVIYEMVEFRDKNITKNIIKLIPETKDIFNNDLIKSILIKITIYPDNNTVIKFKNGANIKVNITR